MTFKFHLRPYLSDPALKSEVLIEQVSAAANSELERQQKLRKEVMSTLPGVSDFQPLCQEKMEVREDRIETVNSREIVKKGKREQTGIKEQEAGTSQLIEGLKAELRRHSFRCSQERHLSRGCRRNREQQGNGKDLLTQDPK